MENQIEILLAEREISRLLSSYAHNLDNGKFDIVSDILKNASIEVPGNLAKGKEEIKNFLERGVQRYEDGTTRTWHSVSNALIEIDLKNKTAKSSAYFTVHQGLDGLPLQAICTGKYNDTFKLVNGTWAFDTRSVVPHLIGNLHFHVGK